MIQDIELLFDLIESYPGLNIAAVCDKEFSCMEPLSNYATAIEASLHVKHLNPDTTIHIPHENFQFEQQRYNDPELQYDYFFVCASLEGRDDILEICKKIYRAIKNGANLFLRTHPDMSETIQSLLEESNFVAINPIEMDSDTTIISAKRMHGWTKV